MRRSYPAVVNVPLDFGILGEVGDNVDTAPDALPPIGGRVVPHFSALPPAGPGGTGTVPEQKPSSPFCARALPHNEKPTGGSRSEP